MRGTSTLKIAIIVLVHSISSVWDVRASEPDADGSAREWYVGASVGSSEAKEFNGAEIDLALGLLGITSVTSVDDSDVAWKIFGGYQFNENVGLEFGYTDLGKITSTTTLVLPVSGLLVTSAEPRTVALSLLGILPVTDDLSVHGRVGFHSWDVDVSAGAAAAGVAGAIGATNSDQDILYGVGGRYQLTDPIAVRAEWERYEFDGSKFDLFSAGVEYDF